MHQNIINVPMLGEVFTYTEKRDSKAKPRDLKTEEHNEDNVQDSNSAADVVPLEAVSGFDTEPIFNRLHHNPHFQMLTVGY